MSNADPVNALLGKGSEFEGKLTFEGIVRIDGVFSGEIFTADTLIVGEGARVSAQIEAGTLIVHGEVEGDVKTKELIELHAPARLRGNIETPNLVIDRGVVFEGGCKMTGLDAEVTQAKSKPAIPPAPPAKEDQSDPQETLPVN